MYGLGWKYLHDDKADDEAIGNICENANGCNHCDTIFETQSDPFSHGQVHIPSAAIWLLTTVLFSPRQSSYYENKDSYS